MQQESHEMQLKLKSLSERIYVFIDKYAGVNPDWSEHDNCDEDKFTSPDTYQMLSCANEMFYGRRPVQCFSEWGSGGYKPYASKEGKEEHDYLVSEIYKIINSTQK